MDPSEEGGLSANRFDKDTDRLYQQDETGWSYYPKIAGRPSRSSLAKFRDKYPCDTPTCPLYRASIDRHGTITTVLSVATAPRTTVVSPTQPSTLQEAISQLPPSAKWAVQNCQIQDNGDTIADALRNGTAIGVSDGSYKLNFGTASWVLEGPTSHGRITGVSIIPGHADDQSPYRSESGGLYGIAVMVALICKVHAIDHGQAIIACDGESALYQCTGQLLQSVRLVPEVHRLFRILGIDKRTPVFELLWTG